MRPQSTVAVLLIILTLFSLSLPLTLALPPLENSMSFPAGSFVIPMDEKQAERVVVFGFVHALLREPNSIQIFRVIEPPNVTLSTNMTASPKAFTGGPFLVLPGGASKLSEVKQRQGFGKVTVGTLSTQHTLDNIFRVSDPTEILVVKGEPPWGRTDLTLDAMKIPYNLTTHALLTANPNMIFSYTMIVMDCAGWNGFIPSQIADNIRTHVSKGNEVIFTDRALLDMDVVFPDYLGLSTAQPTDKISDAYAYNPPRKYDPTKYGSGADRFAPEYPSQYYNSPPRPSEIKVFTESMGYVVSSVPSAKVNEVRILADSKKLGPLSNQYGILAFYFHWGDGVAEGLAFHPQQQSKSVVGNNGYYAVYEFYGNKFVHGPPPKFFSLQATPHSASTPQGGTVMYTVTVNSFGAFNSPVTLGVIGLPAGATHTFVPPAPQPPVGGSASSALTVMVPLSAPVGTYTLNITGHDPSSPPITKWVLVTLNVTLVPADFQISVSPNALSINVTESRTAIVTVTSVGIFNQNVTLNATGVPSHVAVTFTPPAPKPPPGGAATSVMRITVGADASNGTYPLTIVGTNGTLTRSVPFTLTIVKKAPAPIPWLTILLILLLTIFGVVMSIVAYLLSSRRRGPYARGGRMYVVPAAAQRVSCVRCGRPFPLEAPYCPFCGQRRSAQFQTPVFGPGGIVAGPVRERRATWGFVMALASSILILLNTVMLTYSGFWGPPTNWSAIFWWLGSSWIIGQDLAILIGLVAGLIVMTGGIIMILRKGVIGAVIAFPSAVLAIVIGGGFVAGTILGIVAGILGMLRR